jgi:CubicO group peptidase (beta-lactamase class C family)
VDEGKLAWDDPILKYLPDFELSDEWVTRNITLRDMLSHRSGLGRSMRILYNREYDLPEVIRRMRFMPFLKPFRDAYGYNNYHFMTAGRVIEVVSGVSWPEFMQARIFKPLGMHSTSADLNQLQGQVNISAAHDDLTYSLLPHEARLFSQNQVTPWSDVGNQPAGAINSSAADLTLWMKMLLNNGQHAGAPFLSPQVITEMTTPVSVFKNPLQSELGFLAAMQPEINFYTYGLGWFVLDYKGRRLFFHGGQIEGFNSIVAFFPQDKLALSILVNAHFTMVHAALLFTIADALLGGSQTDWSGALLGMAHGMVQSAEKELQAMTAARKKDVPPTLPLTAYTGTYQNDFVGKTTVTLQEDQLWMRYGTAFYGPLEHWEGDFFHAMWQNSSFDAARVVFTTGDGKVTGLDVEREGKYRKLNQEPA